METRAIVPTEPRTAPIRELPVVGGNLALDFGNTVDDPWGPGHFDHLADYPALVAWAERAGMLPERSGAALSTAAEQQPRRARAVVREAAKLRAVVNDIFGALADGSVPDWRPLRPYVVTALEHATLIPDGARLAPTWEFSDLRSPLWPVAQAAYRLLTDPALSRLKRCVGCPWLFIDQSKNGSRRWCAMEVCGTHEKIRRYVNKRAARHTS